MRIDDKYYLLNGENGTPVLHCAILFKVKVDVNADMTLSNSALRGLFLSQYSSKDRPPITIMPCGYQVEYKTIEDIPDHDVPCPCGSPNHWLVKYER